VGEKAGGEREDQGPNPAGEASGREREAFDPVPAEGEQEEAEGEGEEAAEVVPVRVSGPGSDGAH